MTDRKAEIRTLRPEQSLSYAAIGRALVDYADRAVAAEIASAGLTDVELAVDPWSPRSRALPPGIEAITDAPAFEADLADWLARVRRDDG